MKSRIGITHIVLLCNLLWLWPAALQAVTSPIVINEIDYDQPSTDTAEFLELKNVGPGPVNLGGWTVELINGNAGGALLYGSIVLPNVVLPAGGYYVICGNASMVPNCDLDVTPDSNLIQNGPPDAVGLRQNGTLMDAVSYEGDSGAPYVEGSGVGLADTDTAGLGISRCPDGLDSNVNNQDFVSSPITPGGANDCVTIMRLQGVGHRSPLVSTAVANVPGIVTALATNGFYMQDAAGDGDAQTSDGIFVFTSSAPGVALGDALFVSGTVNEFYSGGSGAGGLSTTELTNPIVRVGSSGNPLPAATVIGSGGRVPPDQVIEDDATGNVETTGVFDPALDGIDFYESLEGMRVQVNDAVAVGPTNAFGEIPVVGDNAANAGLIAPRGALVVRPGDFNPERIILDDALFPVPIMNVGDRITGPVLGVISYSFGNFKLLSTGPLTAQAFAPAKETAAAAAPGELSVAGYVVINLDATDPASSFFAVASQIVLNLRSPDILALTGIQDDNGPTNNGVVDAGLTWATLISNIQLAGGPVYDHRDIAPVDGQDGGEPGGNTRVGFLFRPDRVTFVDRPGGTATAATTVSLGGGGVELSFSPGRIDPNHPAFAGNRKALVGEFVFGGEKVFVVATHFQSKAGDDPLFGRVQPPVLVSEVKRIDQAEVVNDFVDDILALDPGARVMVVGDQNDFPFSTPLQALAGDALTNLVGTLPAGEQYTYFFDGNAQALDNFLVSDRVLAATRGFDIVHANAEFVAADRATDHDPTIGRFCLDSQAPVVTLLQPSYDQTGLPPLTIPINVSFTSSDPGGAPVRELVKLAGCVIYDGATYGDRDGLLSDEAIQLTKYKLCQFMAACGFTTLDYPTVRVEASDACGNVGFDQHIIRRRLLKTEVCAR